MYEHGSTGGGACQRAFAYSRAGLSVIPLKVDGSKHAAIPWKTFQQRQASDKELAEWFQQEAGIGVICGAVSGGLEVLDFDSISTAADFLKGANNAGLQMLIDSMWRVQTPSYGMHLYYRHTATPEGNMKLAMDETGKKVLAETRGEGGYVVAPGSPPTVHTLRKLYKPISGDFAKLPVLSAEERQRVLEYARSFDKREKLPPPAMVRRPVLQPTLAIQNETPGTAFNRQAEWQQILVPFGWQMLFTGSNGITYWRRPEAKTRKWDATTNRDGTDRLWVFSTSTAFRSDSYYEKFAAYALLFHDGNFAAAAGQLARDGYGKLTTREAA